MAYRLDLTAELPKTARQTVREQLDAGAEVLRDRQSDDPVGAVHEARKNVKKSRAVLRLLRPGLRKKTYRQENRALRDAARSVAHVRDADVMVETLDELHERFAGQLPAKAFEDIRDQLVREGDEVRARTGGDLGEEMAETLQGVAGRVDAWPLDHARWPVTLKGIRQTYMRGRKAFAVADADPTTYNLHELRKRVKDLWYHQRLLKPAWSAVLGAQADEAHTLSDLLGDEHDLAILSERLRELKPTPDVDAVSHLIARRRQELLTQIRALGRRVYAENPKRFIRRLRRYLRSAEVADPVPA